MSSQASQAVTEDPESRTRATVAAVMIVKNEAKVIQECLESLAWADEIIVLDSGSEDDTVEIAQRLGAKVHVRSDWEGFGIQRRRAQAFATADYIFAIDADERVTPELRDCILSVLDDPNEACVYEIMRTDWFLGDFLYNRGWHRQTHVRLYARERYQYNDRLVHESVDTQGATVVRLKGMLLHYTCVDYQFFLEKNVIYAHEWARERSEAGKRCTLLGAILHSGWCFVRLYLLHGGFLDGRYGFLFAWHVSQYVFNKYAALWHYNQPQKQIRD